MNWDQALRTRLIEPNRSCSLIIVGETREGRPLCHTDTFELVNVDEREIALSLELPDNHPLKLLHRVGFVEFSFRDSGTLYYANTEWVRSHFALQRCELTLKAPVVLQLLQNRRFPRITLEERLAVTCRIVGLRQNALHPGLPFDAEIVELSGSGLSFISPVALFYPLFLQFDFHLPNSPHPILVRGEVLRITPFGGQAYRAAAEFRHVPGEHLARIVDYCAQNVK